MKQYKQRKKKAKTTRQTFEIKSYVKQASNREQSRHARKKEQSEKDNWAKRSMQSSKIYKVDEQV